MKNVSLSDFPFNYLVAGFIRLYSNNFVADFVISYLSARDRKILTSMPTHQIDIFGTNRK